MGLGITARRLAAGAILAAMAVCSIAAQDASDIELKANFLFNFSKFIDWPAEALPVDGFRICIVGDPRLAASLDPLIAGETSHGRPLLRLQPQTTDAARRCQILYIGARGTDGGRRWLASLRDAPVLTVSDGARFLEQGGAIRFLVEEDRVRFEISTSALRRAHLKPSSKLLGVAARVVEEDPH